MNGILKRIFDDKKEELKNNRSLCSLSELKNMVVDAPPRMDIVKALDRKQWETSRIIAEIKRKTPFKGDLRKNFDPVAIARDYTNNGAAAISILTESKYFGGSLDFLTCIRKDTEIPILRKDFIFEEYQIYESLIFGADCFLLIAGYLEKNHLWDLLELGKEIGLLALVETHNERDMEKAFSVGSQIIGINNRDLTNGKTDLGVCRRLLERYEFKENCILVCESGIHGRPEIEEFEKRGIHAFLVGESLMVSKNISLKLKQLIE